MKLNNNYLKYPLILFIVGGLSAASITATYFFTQPILEVRQQETIKRNLEELYDNIASFEELFEPTQINDLSIQAIYKLRLQDDTTRVVYQTSNIGKNGPIISLISFKNENIDKVKNIIHRETPGVGTRIDEPTYLESITSQKLESMSVDLISGATYSSRALSNSVDAAVSHYLKEVFK